MTQSKIRAVSKRLQKTIKNAERELEELQDECEHPDMEREKSGLFADMCEYCPDCGYSYDPIRDAC